MAKADIGQEAYERGFEATAWLLAVALAGTTALRHAALLPGQRAWLYGLSAAIAAAGVLYFRLMPSTGAGRLRYDKEDKALVASLTFIILLTAALWVLVVVPPSLLFLYLLPLFAGALVFRERVVAAEAAVILLALAFLRAASLPPGARLLDGEFAVLAASFLAVAGLTIGMTFAVRRSYEQAAALSAELSSRIEQVRAITLLVQEGDLVASVDRLLRRAAGVLAAALGSDMIGVFLRDAGSGRLVLREESVVGSGWRKRLEAEDAAERLAAVAARGEACLVRLDGEDGAIECLAVPLRVRDASIGVVVAGGRPYAEDDLRTCELFAGCVAPLIDSALLFRRMSDEKRAVDRMAKLLVGRELKMKELKAKFRDDA